MVLVVVVVVVLSVSACVPLSKLETRKRIHMTMTAQKADDAYDSSKEQVEIVLQPRQAAMINRLSGMRVQTTNQSNFNHIFVGAACCVFPVNMLFLRFSVLFCSMFFMTCRKTAQQQRQQQKQTRTTAKQHGLVCV